MTNRPAGCVDLPENYRSSAAGASGCSALLPAVIAAWIPNFMFAMIAVAIFLFGEER